MPTHTHTQPFYGSLDFVRDNPGEPVSEETFTHSHLLWSSVIPYLLPPSITGAKTVVQFTCLTVFSTFSKFSLVYLLAWHPPLCTPFFYFTQPLSSFCSTCPYHCSLFCCSTEIMSCNPSLSLNPLLGTLSCSWIPHIHVTVVISAWWSATSLYLRPR